MSIALTSVVADLSNPYRLALSQNICLSLSLLLNYLMSEAQVNLALFVSMSDAQASIVPPHDPYIHILFAFLIRHLPEPGTY